MPTVNVGPGSSHELQQIADALGKSRKVVVVTGAGISTNCGIPDFRSEDGLYSLIQAQYDAALQNPPWEHTNTFDIDDRPKKRAKPSYFYEVVAPDGNVVGVIDEFQSSTSTQESGSTPPPTRTQTVLNSSSPLSTRSTTPSVEFSDAGQSSRHSSPSPQLLPESTPMKDESASAGPDPLSVSSLERVNQPAEAIHVEITSIVDSENSLPGPSPISDSQTTFSSVESSVSKATSTTSTASSSSSCTPNSSIATSTTNSRPSSRASLRKNKSSNFISGKSVEASVTQLTASTESILNPNPQQTPQCEESSLLAPPSEGDSLPATQSSQSSRTSLPNMKGRDLFDSMIWKDPFTTSIFYMFISSLRQKVRNEVTTTTETHQFIKVLRDGGRLVRNYTQNIDCLEERLGLCTDLKKGPGNRSRFHSKTQREPRPSIVDEDSAHNGGVECVLLHGGLGQLRCDICKHNSDWEDPERESATLAGRAPDCPHCEINSSNRTKRGRRSLAVGRLRPDIVLYGEEHPHANLVGPLITHDLGLGPDVLLIMGTSLKVHGLKVMIREFAKAIHTRGGSVVFVNNTKPPESTWGDVIDYWVQWDCDAWVLDLKQRRSDIWLPQGTIEEKKRRESSGETKPEAKRDSKKAWRPQATRDDKMNGVYVTFNILDILGKFPDAEGRTATRFPYFKISVPRASTGSMIKPEPSKKANGSKKARKSAPAKAHLEKVATANTSKKRKSLPALTRKDQPAAGSAYRESEILEKWKSIRRLAPGLPSEPPRGYLSSISSNIVADFFKTKFAFNATSNHLPNLGGKVGWPLEKINLLTHPPHGSELPIHHSPKELSPSSSPPIVPKYRPTNHAYGTRSSGRFSNAETIVVDDTVQASTWSSEEDTIVINTTLPPLEGEGENEYKNPRMVTPPDSGLESRPMTPSSQRIKRMGSIGAILSSPEEEREVWHDAPEEITS